MSELQKAKVFKTGRSQAVRIPLEFRFNTDEVYIRRDSKSGDVILSPATKSWDDIFAALDSVDMPEDFLANRDQGIPQRRPDF